MIVKINIFKNLIFIFSLLFISNSYSFDSDRKSISESYRIQEINKLNKIDKNLLSKPDKIKLEVLTRSEEENSPSKIKNKNNEGISFGGIFVFFAGIILLLKLLGFGNGSRKHGYGEFDDDYKGFDHTCQITPGSSNFVDIFSSDSDDMFSSDFDDDFH